MNKIAPKSPQYRSKIPGKRYLLAGGEWLLAKWWRLLVFLALSLLSTVLLLPLRQATSRYRSSAYWDNPRSG